MAKNIIIFSDGTGQDGGVRAEQRLSNIYKMYRACRVSPETIIDPKDQVAFYDPGLGTETTATGMTGLVRWTQKTLASVSGRGITTNIVDCYEFLINHYEPGDRIFLFGFSRGAYTVRSIANLLMLCGVPTRHDDQSLQRFRKSIRDIADEAVHDVLEHGAGHPRAEFEDERLELARRFRAEYGADHESGEAHRSNAAPYFIGVFDTVAALGVKGALAIAIKVSLGIGAGVLAAVLSAIPSLAIAGILFLFGFSFWWSVLALVAAAAFLAARSCFGASESPSGRSSRTFRILAIDPVTLPNGKANTSTACSVGSWVMHARQTRSTKPGKTLPALPGGPRLKWRPTVTASRLSNRSGSRAITPTSAVATRRRSRVSPMWRWGG